MRFVHTNTCSRLSTSVVPTRCLPASGDSELYARSLTFVSVSCEPRFIHEGHKSTAKFESRLELPVCHRSRTARQGGLRLHRTRVNLWVKSSKRGRVPPNHRFRHGDASIKRISRRLKSEQSNDTFLRHTATCVGYRRCLLRQIW